MFSEAQPFHGNQEIDISSCENLTFKQESDFQESNSVQPFLLNLDRILCHWAGVFHYTDERGNDHTLKLTHVEGRNGLLIVVDNNVGHSAAVHVDLCCTIMDDITIFPGWQSRV